MRRSPGLKSLKDPNEVAREVARKRDLEEVYQDDIERDNEEIRPAAQQNQYARLSDLISGFGIGSNDTEMPEELKLGDPATQAQPTTKRLKIENSQEPALQLKQNPQQHEK